LKGITSTGKSVWCPSADREGHQVNIRKKAMQAALGILKMMVLILLILMNIVGCNGESSNNGNLTASYVNNSDDSGYIMLDTGQIVCSEYSDGHVTCTFWKGKQR
jgi:hypothetical protein